MAFEVEPVVTLEKLRTLLAEQHEQPALDYKRTLNLGRGNAADTVELTKDVAAMQAEPNGGYIIIGADDQGQPVPDLTADLAKRFDEATLRPKVDRGLGGRRI
ncbi:AlbA family DNA-binding domain-containing protein [Nocardia tengchongensis]